MKKFIVMFAAIVAAVNLSAQTTTDTKTGKCGQTATITATADPGYEFAYWEDAPTNTNNVRTVTISAEMPIDSFVAVFRAKTMTMTLQSNNADWGTVTLTGTPTCDSQVTLTAAPTDGCYKFIGWQDDPTITTATRTVTVASTDAANTYTAIFAEVEFTVKATSQQHGSVSISVQ